MESIGLALVAFFGWGIGDIFAVFSSRKIGSSISTLWNLILGFIVFSTIIPFQYQNLFYFTPTLIFLTFGLSIFFIIGLLAFYEAIKIDNSSITGTIAAAFSALAAILSLIFFNEKLDSNQIIAIIIIYIGILLAIFDAKDLIKRRNPLTRGVGYALVAMLFWGIFAAFIKIPVESVGWFWPAYSYYCLFPLLFIFYKLKKIKLKTKKKSLKLGIFFVFLTVFMIGIAQISYNIAISYGQISVIAPIAGSYPVLFVILSYLIFHDPLRKQQIIGIITSLFGIITLSLLSR